jgi:hypothetical protein
MLTDLPRNPFNVHRVWKLTASAGCLSGDTIVEINRGGNSTKIRLDKLVRKFNEERKRTKSGAVHKRLGWDHSIPTRIRSNMDGQILLVPLISAFPSGKKKTYLLKTVSGRSIRATSEHPFRTNLGWKKLEKLKVGDSIVCDGGHSSRGCKDKTYYFEICLMNHPFCSSLCHSFRVPVHRVVAEAVMNGMRICDFIRRVRAGDLEGLRFLDPKVFVVHHKNADPFDNGPDNLEVLTHEAHRKKHANEEGWRNVAISTSFDDVESLEPFGVEETYDLTVYGDDPNYIANGLVVHNSGKSFYIKRTISELIDRGAKPSSIMYALFNRSPSITFRGFFPELTSADMRWWGTFHSVSMKLLKLKHSQVLDASAWGKEHGFDISGKMNAMEGRLGCWDRTYADVQKRVLDGVPQSAWKKSESRLWNALVGEERATGRTCFTRMISRVCDGKLFPEGVEYVFLDEGQDNSKIQLDWLDWVIKSRPDVKGIMIAGDDKQALNRFRGGRHDEFVKLEADESINIPVTYRCSQPILDFANRIASRMKNRSDLATVSMRETPNPAPVRRLQTLESATHFIIKQLGEGKRVAVLARDNVSAFFARKTLISRGIPTEEDVFAHLAVTHSAFARIALSGYATEGDVTDLLPALKPRKGDLERTLFDIPLVTRIRMGDIPPESLPTYSALRLGHAPIADLVHVGFSRKLVDALLVNALRTAMVNATASQVRAYRAFPLQFVQVGTIHSSKGNEYDTVVLLTDVTRKTFDSEQRDPQEAYRVWYTACTRARDELIITSVKGESLKTRII